MSTFEDRAGSILGRRRSASSPASPLAPRAAKSVVSAAPGDPEAWRAFKPNPLLYARHWLETGELPADCHFLIRERLAAWFVAVEAGGPDLRASLLAVIPKIEPRMPEPSRVSTPERRCIGGPE